MTTSRRGTYYVWHPADAAILERLPTEGSIVGYKPLAATVKRLRESLNKDVPEEGQLTAEEITTRLRSMHVVDLVVKIPVMGAGGSHGWQRTRKGELKYGEMTGLTLGPTHRKELRDESA